MIRNRTKTILSKMMKVVDANCVICQGVLREPCTIKTCTHTFCKECIFGWMGAFGEKKEKLKCPTCTIQFLTQDVVVNTEIIASLSKISETCACGLKVPLIDLEMHRAACEKYQKGVKDIAKKMVKPPPARQKILEMKQPCEQKHIRLSFLQIGQPCSKGSRKSYSAKAQWKVRSVTSQLYKLQMSHMQSPNIRRSKLCIKKSRIASEVKAQF
eukprot:TRINITY_DN3469_c0_g1_i2.p1 TRINITY_DN3469_c0_g1~~TRINITY_DN3469_c0_g1_i2.p1  ORF type:complete len:213 (-),score=10.95 TRINITY_DN3469_c0_g1_i2:62-700(-)